MLEAVKEMRRRVQLGKRKMAVEKEKEDAARERGEFTTKNKLVDEVMASKQEREIQLLKDEAMQNRLRTAIIVFRYAAIAASVMMVVIVSVRIASYAKQQKEKLAKFQKIEAPQDAQSLKACDFAKQFISEYSSDPQSVDDLWSEMDDDDRAAVELSLRQISPSDLSFKSVLKANPTTLMVIGSCKDKQLKVLLMNSPEGFQFRNIQIAQL